MGTSAARLTRGYAQVPNNFIENLSLLMPAEVAMALLLFRVGGNTFSLGGVETPNISDEHWERWTGFKARQKEYALAGLKKICISIEGRGENARIIFEPERWKAYVKEQSGKQVEPRTAGRAKTAAVKSNPGMMVHPDCKEHGCQNLCGQGEKPSPCLVDLPSPLPLPAAPKPAATPPPKRPMKPAAAATAENPSTRDLVSAPGRNKRIAAFTETLAVLSGIFPTCGAEFLWRLVGRARGVCPTIDDQRLAAAVRACWQAKKRTQRSEGLFLETVPKYLENFSRFADSSSGPCSQCLDTGNIVENADSPNQDDWKLKPCPKCKGSSVGATA